MKLVWMVLFALPLFTLTACGDDDEPAEVKINDLTYSLAEDGTSASFTFGVSATGLSAEEYVSVSYSFNNSVIDIAKGTDGKYAFTLSGLTPGRKYSVNITAALSEGTGDVETVEFLTPLFPNYSILLDKTRQEVRNFFTVAPQTVGDYGQYYALDGKSIKAVEVYFTFFQEDSNGEYITSDEAEIVISNLVDTMEANKVQSYLDNLYKYKQIDEDGSFVFEGDDMEVWFYPEDKQVWYVDDDYYDTRAGGRAALKEAVKAARASFK